MELFVCKFTIGYRGLCAEDPKTKQLFREIHNHLVGCAKMLWADMSCGYYIDQPEFPNGLDNSHIRTDIVCIYRFLNHTTSIPHIAKLCEGYAGILSINYDVSIHVSYTESLPQFCHEPHTDFEDYVEPDIL